MENILKNQVLEVHESKPEGFSEKIQVGACYVEIDNKLLLLQLSSTKSESGKWGVPAGKLEKNESPLNGAIRELFEETGITIDLSSQIQSLGSLYIRKKELDYIYHMFKVKLDQMPKVHLSAEHQNYTWASLKELEELPLMEGAKEALRHYQLTSIKKRSGTSVNSFLILKKNHQVLFQLRKNTGYCDGMWCLVAGHVEDGESATEALIREAKEEIGITLIPSQLKVVHVMHRKTNRLNIDIFFECQSWQGLIKNLEPEKCEKLEFFSLDSLPSNRIDTIDSALNYIKNEEFYSEQGWDL